MVQGSAKHRPWFHASGFIVGGFLTHLLRLFLPSGAVKEFLTTGMTAAVGPLTLDLIIISIGLGPIALDVSLLSLVGVLAAYLVARSLF
jgi:hypothetical protein